MTRYIRKLDDYQLDGMSTRQTHCWFERVLGNGASSRKGRDAEGLSPRISHILINSLWKRMEDSDQALLYQIYR